MSKASILRQLPDADLEAIHHLIRRDALSDAQIAAECRRRGLALEGTPEAQAAVIARYRAGAEYRRWLDRWENQDAALKRDLEGQKQRFELVSSLVKGTEKGGLEAVSQGLMARLLTLAAEMNDDELVEAAKGRHGWVGKVIQTVQAQTRLEERSRAERAESVVGDKKLTPDQQRAKIREIFGMA